jgi:hypothetical protein
MAYFEEIILTSVNMPLKQNYSIEEAAEILDIPIKQVLKFGQNYEKQTGRVRLKIEGGKVSYDTFVKFFEQ